MAEVLVVGGGVVGLGLGMMLARRCPLGHHSRAGRPAGPRGSRRGLGQLGTQGGEPVPPAPPFPLLVTATSSRRSCPTSPPPSRGTAPCTSIRCRTPRSPSPDRPRSGDGRYEMLSGRRAVVERAVAAVADGTPGLEVRRGVAVAGLIEWRRGDRGHTPRGGRPHHRGRGATGRPGHRLRRPPLGAPGLVGGPGGAASGRTRSTTADSSTSGGTSVPVTVSCRWRSGPASSRTAPFPCSCSRPTTARGRSPSSPDQGIGPSSGSRTRRGGSAPCGRCPRRPIGSTATRSRTAS